MELTKIEVAAVEPASVVLEKTLMELCELDLDLVGGGMGDIVLVRR